jgi:hypothetical protein
VILRSQELTLSSVDWVDEIERRLTGRQSNVLPPLTRDEDPADIFVDLAEIHPQLKPDLGSTLNELLARWTEWREVDHSIRIKVLGELCYLAARIGSTGALSSLRKIVEDATATGLVAPGEDLRLRALRALIGLLGAAGRDQAAEHRQTLLSVLAEPRLAIAALIGLVGLWPAEAETFLRLVPPSAEGGELLPIGVKLAFPDSETNNDR